MTEEFLNQRSSSGGMMNSNSVSPFNSLSPYKDDLMASHLNKEEDIEEDDATSRNIKKMLPNNEISFQNSK